MESIANKDAWNSLVLQTSHSFFQSWEWGELQEKLGRKTFRLMMDGVPLAFYRFGLPLGKSYLYAPGAPAILKKNTEAILELRAQAPDALFAKIETCIPNAKLPGAPFCRGAVIQPVQISIKDISASEEDILKNMEHDTRYAIRAAEKRGVEVKIFSSPEERRVHFPEFWELFENLNARKKLSTYSKEYYEGVAALKGECFSKLFVAYVEGKAANAAIAVYFGTVVYYLFAASAQGYGKYNAPSLLLWRIIQDGKREQCTSLNLGGISYTKPSQKGLTGFKKSFGAEEITMPGAWDLPFHRAWYEVYRIAKRFA